MKKLFLTLTVILSVSALLGLQQKLNTPEQNELFTIYLVRHAEKDSGSNPPLTQCGEKRAQHLNTFLDEVQLSAVYSTDYKRTMSTALPTAQSKGLEIQQYDASDLKAFSKFLTAQKQDALVVGHSNTTGELAGLLIGEEVEDIDLDTYNRIYQVVIRKNDRRLHLFHTSFTCDD